MLVARNLHKFLCTRFLQIIARETAELRNIADDSAETLAQAELPESKLKQVYWINLKGYRKPILALFDSGATSSFISADLANSLRLPLKPSRLKAVATATGRTTPITAAIDLELSLDATTFPIQAHILPTFLPSIQLIIGEDFMIQNEVSLSYGPSQCTLLSRSDRPMVISRSLATGKPHPMPTERHGVDEVESDDHEISAAMALRLLKRKGLKPFLVLIMPKESPDSEAAALDTLPSAAPKYRLPPEYQTELSELLDQFPDVFSESPKAGGANVDPLRNIIDLVPGSKPPFRKNYRLSPRELQELRDQVSDKAP